MAIDVLIVSPDEKEQRCLKEICDEFQYNLAVCKNFDELLEYSQGCSLVVLSHKAMEKSSQVAELMQAARQTLPGAFQALIVADNLPKEEANFLRKSGANLIALASELEASSKFWFAINQVLRATYLPVKAVDLVPDVPIPFTIYHLMPARKKFLPVVHAGDALPGAKLAKLGEVHEYYFRRTESAQYKEFIESTSDKSAQGLAKRCRANFLALQSEFTTLVFSLTDQSDAASFGEGQELVGRCRKLCEDLMSNLAEFPRAWEIINSSSIGEFGSLERAPAIAAYVGIFGLQMELPKLSELMLVALLVDLGLIKISPAATKGLRRQESLGAEGSAQMKAVPEVSLKMILDRKLSLDEKSRSIMLSTYERCDGKGYPKGITGLKLSTGAQLVNLAREFDKGTLLQMGRMRREPLDVLREMLQAETPEAHYTGKFLAEALERIGQGAPKPPADPAGEKTEAV